MSEIIRGVREVMQYNNQSSMNVNEIIKKIQKSHLAIRVTKDEMLEVLNHYKKLQIIYLDQDENVVFL